MATIHLLLQGKGGVGKSYVASILFQYLRKHELPVIGYDTDPVNATFAGYKEFGVKTIDLMRGDDIDPLRFDQLIDAACALEDNSHLVIDSGASCFVALCSYLKANHALDILSAEGQEIVMHTVVTGGQAMGDTLAGLRSLAKNFPETPKAVWLNPYFGEISLDGNDFYSFKVYAEDAEAFRAVIELPALRADTFGRDLDNILSRRVSFDAAVKSSLPIMTRSRLFNIWKDIEEAIDKARLIN